MLQWIRQFFCYCGSGLSCMQSHLCTSICYSDGLFLLCYVLLWRVPCKTVEYVMYNRMLQYNMFEVCYIPVMILSSSVCKVIISCLLDNCFCPTMYYKAVPQSGNKTKQRGALYAVFSGFTSRPELLGTPFYYSFSQAHKNDCTTQSELQNTHRKTYTPWSYQIVKLVKGLIQLGIWMFGQLNAHC
jgi:hypothetical protein